MSVLDLQAKLVELHVSMAEAGESLDGVNLTPNADEVLVARFADIEELLGEVNELLQKISHEPG